MKRSDRTNTVQALLISLGIHAILAGLALSAPSDRFILTPASEPTTQATASLTFLASNLPAGPGISPGPAPAPGGGGGTAGIAGLGPDTHDQPAPIIAPSHLANEPLDVTLASAADFSTPTAESQAVTRAAEEFLRQTPQAIPLVGTPSATPPAPSVPPIPAAAAHDQTLASPARSAASTSSAVNDNGQLAGAGSATGHGRGHAAAGSGNGLGVGAGSGTGSGYGSGTGRGNGAGPGSGFGQGGTGDGGAADAPITVLYRASPVYPDYSRRNGHQGTVVLLVHVRADGSIADVRVVESSGYKKLDQAAVDAARASRYAPARANYQPIAATRTIAFEFRLTHATEQTDSPDRG